VLKHFFGWSYDEVRANLVYRAFTRSIRKTTSSAPAPYRMESGNDGVAKALTLRKSRY
jgi:hypothetical protein